MAQGKRSDGQKRRMVDWEEFARVYMDVYEREGSVRDLAKELDTKYEIVLGRIAAARKMGLALPAFKRSSQSLTKIQLEHINGMIASRKMVDAPKVGMKKPPVV